jgi:hypothetical protein
MKKYCLDMRCIIEKATKVSYQDMSFISHKSKYRPAYLPWL